MAAFGAAAIVVGTILKVQAARQQYKMDSAVYKHNELAYELQAKEARRAAAEREREVRKAADRARGTALTRYAKAGVSPDTGTPLETLQYAAGEYAVDAMRIRREGELQASMYRAKAGLAHYQRRAVRTAGRYQVAGSILTGSFLLGQQMGLGSSGATPVQPQSKAAGFSGQTRQDRLFGSGQRRILGYAW